MSNQIPANGGQPQISQRSEYQKIWRSENPRDRREYFEGYRKAVKTTVLSHYGKAGIPACCWTGCNVIDLDMLSLDHVENNGNSERERTGILGGYPLYLKLKKEGFPEGFQTLCFNHQMKKAILVLRERKGQSYVKSASGGRWTTAKAY